MQITVKSDISRISRLPMAIERQFNFAVVPALNNTAFKAREDLGRHAKNVFKMPVPRTINAGMVERATRKKLSARVYLREDMTSGIQPGKFLRAEIEGGIRRDKRLERALRQTSFTTKKHGGKKVLPDGYLAVPHPSFTNMRGNLTAPRSRAIIADMKRNGRGQTYFVIHPDFNRAGSEGMQPGIYMRRGKNLKLVIVFVKANQMQYQRKYKFYDVVGATYNRWFKIYMRKNFERALRTMRV